MADASSTATFLLTRQGHVVHSNATAGELLSDGRSLMIQEGVLVAKEPQSGESLNAFLGKTALSPFSMASHIPAYALSLQRNHARHPLHLLAIPLSPTQGSRTGADILLLVTDPEEITRFPDSILRALYDLTPSETEVANGLLMGCSLEEIASLRRVALGTVRMQVKSLLGKTETTRQSELIRLLTTLPQLPTAN
jgi:DNA-binding CsgD family transcriptional regulator